MDDVEQEIERRMEPYQDDVKRLCSIPGVERVTAWGLLAEIGFNMDQFPSAAHLASWAGLCPGNFESAGKRLSGKTRRLPVNNRFVRVFFTPRNSLPKRRSDSTRSPQKRRSETMSACSSTGGLAIRIDASPLALTL